MSKTFTIVPRGIDLVIGCNTFPTWNSYPGLFAGLATGNAVLVKPHPRAVLPLAITVRIVREVLRDHGSTRTSCAWPPSRRAAAWPPSSPCAPEVGIVDYTGSSSFGDWLEQHARQAQVYTEKAGVNAVVVDSTDDYRGHARQPRLLAGALQRADVHHAAEPPRAARRHRDRQGHVGVEQLGKDLGTAIDGLLGDDAKAADLLGAVVNDDVLHRVESAPSLGAVAVVPRGRSGPRRSPPRPSARPPC